MDLDAVEDDGPSWEEDYFFGGGGKFNKIISTVSAARLMWSTSKSVYDYIQQKRSLSVTVVSSDPNYISILEWVASEAFGAKAKDIALITSNTTSYSEDDLIDAELSGVSGRDSQKLKLVHNAKTPQYIRVDNHKIKVWLAEDSDTPRRGVTAYQSRIVFSMFTKEAQTSLIGALRELHNRRQKQLNPPKLFTPSGWGGFGNRGELPKRSVDSVILKKGEMEELINDLSLFLTSESNYVDLGLSWHRGYLFFGEPGCGKSSIAKALAGHFGLDVYYVPLGDIKDDTSFNKLVDGLQPKSVLLLEDVDVFSAATSREAGANSVSLSGLLNVLDGVATPHGLISILTTNDVDKLDSALTRPGRVDMKKEFTVLDQDQGERLFNHFYGVWPEGINFEGRTPASVVSVFKNNFQSAVNAMRELEKQCV